MAASHAFIQLVLALALVPTMATATVFIVGDEAGWTTGFDYQAWAQGKVFKVGDRLEFKYAAGSHNVARVGQAGFINCRIPAGVTPLTSGDDQIEMLTPGKKWWICGVSDHCESGQKLSITVLGAEAPTPWPAPLPAPAKPGQMA